MSIALLREDGYLIPVASVTGDRFAPLLAQSTLQDNTNVFTMRARELGSSRWFVSHRSGETSEITVLNRAMVDDHCTSQEMWRTSFEGKRVAPYVSDVAKIGIAVRGGTADQPQDATSQPDESSKRMARLAMDTAVATERKRSANDPEFRDYSISSHNSVSRLAKLLRHKRDDITTYFFEVHKSPYPLVTTGWIVDAPAGTTWRGVTLSVNDDVFKEGNIAGVSGLITLVDRTLWLMHWHGYESEYHEIREWPSGRVRLTTPGTGC